jgi:hypothetical protein
MAKYEQGYSLNLGVIGGELQTHLSHPKRKTSVEAK